MEYDHLLNVRDVDENQKFEDVLNEKTRYETRAWADPHVKNLELGINYCVNEILMLNNI